MNDRLSLFTWTCVNAQGRATLKRNASNDIHPGDSFICLTTALIKDGPHWWQIYITFILSALVRRSWRPIGAKSWDSWIKRLLKSQFPPIRAYCRSPFNSPELWIEHRTLVSHSSTLIIWAIGTDVHLNTYISLMNLRVVYLLLAEYHYAKISWELFYWQLDRHGNQHNKHAYVIFTLE